MYSGAAPPAPAGGAPPEPSASGERFTEVPPLRQVAGVAGLDTRRASTGNPSQKPGILLHETVEPPQQLVVWRSAAAVLRESIGLLCHNVGNINGLLHETVGPFHHMPPQPDQSPQSRRRGRPNWQLLGKFNSLIHPHLGDQALMRGWSLGSSPVRNLLTKDPPSSRLT